MSIKQGIYIHWPFCKSKCPYCDFFSKVQKNIEQDDIIGEYLQDIAYWSQVADIKRVESIFFGGGTPSLLSPKNIAMIIDEVAKYWQLDAKAEISLEANPNTNHKQMFSDLKKAGINRLSLGIQSLRDDDLLFLGRTHNAKEALISASEVLQLFDNNSADIIYARPNQTADCWQQEMEQLCKLGFKHLSLYQLTIEEGTIFFKKGIKAAHEDEAVKLYNLSDEVLRQYGYHNYEVSNYAQEGFECRHNKLYWQGDDYVGVGKGAHGRMHCANKIIATTHHLQQEILTADERAEELVLMGLRLRAGIDKQHFKECCGIEFEQAVNRDAISELADLKLIEDNLDNIRATKQGFLLLNKVIEKLCC